MTTLVETTFHVEQIKKTMQDENIYNDFVTQLERVKANPNRAYNAIVMGEFYDGRGTVRFVSYHFHPDDPGWRMITIYDADPEIVELVKQSIETGFCSPVTPMFIDDAEMRN